MKFASLRAARRYWIAGIALAVIGVVVVRFVAPQFAPQIAFIIKALGRLAALAGLIVICIGVSRRVTDRATEETDSPSDKPK